MRDGSVSSGWGAEEGVWRASGAEESPARDRGRAPRDRARAGHASAARTAVRPVAVPGGAVGHSRSAFRRALGDRPDRCATQQPPPRGREVQREQLPAQQQRRADTEEKAVRSAEQGKRLLEAQSGPAGPGEGQGVSAKEFLETVESWGFSRGEIDVGSLDHRLIHHAVADRRDAQKWRQLEANKAKAAKKAEGAPRSKPLAGV
jgi:hypothetical protein